MRDGDCFEKEIVVANDTKSATTWYARRDSNPQPSEPESDALSIEPLARFKRVIIIADPLPFVKPNFLCFFASNKAFWQNYCEIRLFSREPCAIIKSLLKQSEWRERL